LMPTKCRSNNLLQTSYQRSSHCQYFPTTLFTGLWNKKWISVCCNFQVYPYRGIVLYCIYFTFQRSVIGNKTLGHGTSHNTCNSYICNLTYNCLTKIKTSY
jgi:hypothetical protein